MTEDSRQTKPTCMDCCSLSLSAGWWMCAASVNTVQADKQEDKQAEQGRKMATNMDEEQSLRECEAYVQMHGESPQS